MQRNQSGRVGPAQQGQLQLSMLVEEATHEKGGWAQESGRGRKAWERACRLRRRSFPLLSTQALESLGSTVFTELTHSRPAVHRQVPSALCLHISVYTHFLSNDLFPN